MPYGPYKKILMVIIAVGFLAVLWSPVLGVILIFLAAASFAVLRMVEIFDESPED
jgi:hypothetical protein